TATVSAIASSQAVDPVDREASVQKESRGLASPSYPADALDSRTSGKVVMRVLVGTDGNVKDVVVEESVPAGVFEAASIEAVRKWQFNPAIKDGKPVEDWLRIPVEFEIDDPE